MRQIITISLPPEMKKEVDEAIKSGLYASQSEFFRDLLRMWREQEYLQKLKREEIKSKKRKSMKKIIKNHA